jgi:hypothetical protein
MYTRCQWQLICLHSSIFLFAMQQAQLFSNKPLINKEKGRRISGGPGGTM